MTSSVNMCSSSGRKKPERTRQRYSSASRRKKTQRQWKTWNARACYTNFNFVEDYDHGDDTVERADTSRAHSDLSNLGGDGREEVLVGTVDEKNDTCSPNVVPGDVFTFKATGLGTIAPFEMVQAKERGHLPFGREKGKSKGKGKFLVRPSCLALENRRQRMKELKPKTECDVYGRGRTLGIRSRTRNVCIQFVSENPDTCSSNDETTTPLQPTGEGHNVLRSQRLQ